jgi:hypothetical protein
MMLRTPCSYVHFFEDEARDLFVYILHVSIFSV